MSREPIDEADPKKSACSSVRRVPYQRRDRAERYVQLEAGHAAQNVLLQAVSLGLGAVPIGAFHDAEVQEVLGLPPQHEPLYLIPVGDPLR